MIKVCIKKEISKPLLKVESRLQFVMHSPLRVKK